MKQFVYSVYLLCALTSGGQLWGVEDYYAVLGVSPTATRELIYKKYRKLAAKTHPDATKNDPEKTKLFKQYNEAWEVLGDDDKRRTYDGLDGRESQEGTTAGKSESVDLSELAKSIADQYPKQKWQYDPESLSFIDPRVGRRATFDLDEGSRYGFYTEEGWFFDPTDGSYYDPETGSFWLFPGNKTNTWQRYENGNWISINPKNGFIDGIPTAVSSNSKEARYFRDLVEAKSPERWERLAESFESRISAPAEKQEFRKFIDMALKAGGVAESAVFIKERWSVAERLFKLPNFAKHYPDVLLNFVNTNEAYGPRLIQQYLTRSELRGTPLLVAIFKSVLPNSINRIAYLEGLLPNEWNGHELQLAEFRKAFPKILEVTQPENMVELVRTVSALDPLTLESIHPEMNLLLNSSPFSQAIADSLESNEIFAALLNKLPKTLMSRAYLKTLEITAAKMKAKYPREKTPSLEERARTARFEFLVRTLTKLENYNERKARSGCLIVMKNLR